MGKIPKKFSGKSPDPTLEQAIADGMQGATAPARMAHVNAVIEVLKMTQYGDDEEAREAGLKEGDLYVDLDGVVRCVLPPEEPLIL